MYNRYIPQSDGTFRRSRVEEPEPVTQTPEVPMPEEPPKIQQEKPPMHHRNYPQRTGRPQRRDGNRSSNGTSVGSFLKQLMPQNFDTEDLIVVLLLLLMSGDTREDQNTALLTLVIYLFL